MNRWTSRLVALCCVPLCCLALCSTAIAAPGVWKRILVPAMWLIGVVLIAQLTATVTSSQTVARLQSKFETKVFGSAEIRTLAVEVPIPHTAST